MSDLTEPPIERLLAATGSKFQLVTFAARRARDINSYFGQLGHGLGMMIPPLVSSTSRKPLSIALEEIAAGKIRIGNLVEDPFFDLALRTLLGAGVELYIQGSDLRDFERVELALEMLADLDGRGLSVEELVRGSFLAKLRPYGAGGKLTPSDKSEIEHARRVRPIPGIEGPAAVEFQRRLMIMVETLRRSPPPCAFLADGLLLAKIQEGDEPLTVSRELSEFEWAEYCAGRLRIDLTDVAAVVDLIRSAPRQSAMTG